MDLKELKSLFSNLPQVNATANELANLWKNTHPELSQAIACKVYIIDTNKYNYKQHLIHIGVKPEYDAKKGVLFTKNMLN